MLGRTRATRSTAVEVESAARGYLERASRSRPDPKPAELGSWSGFADQGWFRLLVHSDRGGFGLSIIEGGHLFFATGRHLVGGPLPDHVVALPLLCNELRTTTQPLEAALDGSTRVVFADPAVELVRPLRTTAPVIVAGKLRAIFPLVANVAIADAIVLEARAEDGPAVCWIPASAEGVRVTPLDAVDAATAYGELRIDLAVESEHVLLRGADAARYLALARASLAAVASCELSGIAAHLGEMAVAYSLERRQFGRPIGSFQALQHLLADMSVSVTALRNLCISGLAELAESPTAAWVTAAVMKSYATRTAQRVAEDALQVLGGIGFTEEHDLHRFLKRILAIAGWYGDHRELNVRLGSELLRRGASDGPWASE